MIGVGVMSVSRTIAAGSMRRISHTIMTGAMSRFIRTHRVSVCQSSRSKSALTGITTTAAVRGMGVEMNGFTGDLPITAHRDLRPTLGHRLDQREWTDRRTADRPVMLMNRHLTGA